MISRGISREGKRLLVLFESYLVLGDSLAIGFEPGMTSDMVPYGYTDRLFEQALIHGRAASRIHESAGEIKIYIPLRLMAEGVGFDVQFIEQSRTAYINP
jgi:hypothetical protein